MLPVDRDVGPKRERLRPEACFAMAPSMIADAVEQRRVEIAYESEVDASFETRVNLFDQRGEVGGELLLLFRRVRANRVSHAATKAARRCPRSVGSRSPRGSLAPASCVGLRRERCVPLESL